MPFSIFSEIIYRNVPSPVILAVMINIVSVFLGVT